MGITGVDRQSTIDPATGCEVPSIARNIPECFEASNWNEGWVCEPMREVLRALGAKLIVFTPANNTVSQTEYSGSSSYTRCVYMIKQGEADICVSDFWETTERRNLASFSSAIAEDYVQLVTKPSVRDGFSWPQAWMVFAPFSASSWIFIFVWCTFAAVWMLIADHPHVLGIQKSKAFEGASRPLVNLEAVCLSTYLASIGFLLKVPQHSPARLGGQIVLVGFSLMLYWTLACYIAQMVNIFRPAQPFQLPEVSDLKSAVRSGKHLCMLEALMPDMLARGISKKNIKGLDSYGPVLEHLYLGNCEASLVGRHEIIRFIQGQTGEFNVCSDPDDPNGYSWCTTPFRLPVRIHLDCQCKTWTHLGNEAKRCKNTCPTAKRYCNLMSLPDPFLSIPYALPIQSDFRDFVSAQIMKLVEENQFKLLSEL